MSAISTKISKKYRYFFYVILALSCVSGSGFWLIREFGMVEGDFGSESHFLQYPLLQVHGFLAFVMLMSIGAIFSSHVTKTWSAGRAKKLGITLLVHVIFMLLSAYSLYYLVSEDWHVLLGNSHAVFGLLLPLMLFTHVKLARKSRKKSKSKRKKYLHVKEPT